MTGQDIINTLGTRLLRLKEQRSNLDKEILHIERNLEYVTKIRVEFESLKQSIKSFDQRSFNYILVRLLAKLKSLFEGQGDETLILQGLLRYISLCIDFPSHKLMVVKGPELFFQLLESTENEITKILNLYVTRNSSVECG